MYLFTSLQKMTLLSEVGEGPKGEGGGEQLIVNLTEDVTLNQARRQKILTSHIS